MITPDQAISSEEFEQLVQGIGAPIGPFAVAVSGGADSMALCRLANSWAKRFGAKLTALTVDHDLRRTSAAEANQVAKWMAGLGIAHTGLKWAGPKPQTGVQAAARDARYALMGAWCRDNDVGTLLVAHHRDDQAETYLMRLSRGSGPNGLAGMSTTTYLHGVHIARPLLGIPKIRLLATCAALGQRWIDDPSNHNPRYARTQIRARLAAKENSGDIAEKTQGFGIARAARDRTIRSILKKAATEYAAGFVRLNWRMLTDATEDVGAGALGRVLSRVSGAPHGPRTNKLAALHRAVARGLTATRSLHRCLAMPQADGHVLIFREPRNLPTVPIVAGSKFTWDRRFVVALEPGSKSDGMTVGPLGHKGWGQVRDRAKSAHPTIPTQLCYAVPALFHQERVISAPNLEVPSEMGRFTAQFSPTLSLFPYPFAVVSSGKTPIFREAKLAKDYETPVLAEFGTKIGPFANG